MRMEEIEIYDYARQLLEAHGEMARSLRRLRRLGASRRRVRRKMRKLGEVIEAALKMMRGPHVS
jgi:hypothetical protein